MLMNSQLTTGGPLFDGNAARFPALLPPVRGRSSQLRRPDEHRSHQAAWLYDGRGAEQIEPAVEISPVDAVKRRFATWDGMAAEIVQATRLETIEVRACAPHHLLILYEQGARRDGETVVEGLPRSTLRDCKGKLAFVPAGHEYYERQEPRSLGRVVYFYFDPAKMPEHPDTGDASTALKPRLFFEDATLWDTALKLVKLIESAGPNNRPYFEALGIVLAHELMRVNAGGSRIESAPARGGLAGWQQRIVTAYIEEHLAEQIPLKTLARARSFESRLFLPSVQAVLWHAAASLSQCSPHRAGQDAFGRAHTFCDRNRIEARLQRHELIQHGLSQGDRPDPDCISSQPQLGPPWH